MSSTTSTTTTTSTASTSPTTTTTSSSSSSSYLFQATSPFPHSSRAPYSSYLLSSLPSSSSSSSPLSLFHNILYSSLSAGIAGCFSNPIDVAKTRLQLQGELKKDVVKTYRNVFDCIYKTWKLEGFRGTQRGLTTAVARESSLNCFRIGLYDPILKILHTDSSSPPFSKRLLTGLISSLIGAVASSPFDLLKTRLQSQAIGTNAAVGYQHNYSTLRHGISAIIKTDGVKGLWMGTSAAALRQAIGGTTQVTAYYWLKDQLLHRGYRDTPSCHLMASVLSSGITVVAMNPVDVIRTRIYNQPGTGGRSGTRGNRVYAGVLDALLKIFREEGAIGFYKGLTASFLRLAPHISVTFLVLEQLKKWRPLGSGW